MFPPIHLYALFGSALGLLAMRRGKAGAGVRVSERLLVSAPALLTWIHLEVYLTLDVLAMIRRDQGDSSELAVNLAVHAILLAVFTVIAVEQHFSVSTSATSVADRKASADASLDPVGIGQQLEQERERHDG